MPSSKKQETRSKKSSKKPFTTTVDTLTSSSAEVNPISQAEKLNIESLITQALVRHSKNLVADKKEKFKEISHLSSIAEEYLSCFSLIGYTFEGERVCVFNANSSKDEAALVDLLRSTFLEIANNRP